MDLLSQRYASPFFVLDEFIHLEQLHDFVSEVLLTINNEEKEKYRWEYFLHKVFDKSYEEFLRSSKEGNNDSQTMNEEEIKNVAEESKNILDGFII